MGEEWVWLCLVLSAGFPKRQFRDRQPATTKTMRQILGGQKKKNVARENGAARIPGEGIPMIIEPAVTCTQTKQDVGSLVVYTHTQGSIVAPSLNRAMDGRVYSPRAAHLGHYFLLKKSPCFAQLGNSGNRGCSVQ